MYAATILCLLPIIGGLYAEVEWIRPAEIQPHHIKSSCLANYSTTGLPPDKMEIIIGGIDTEFLYILSFRTNLLHQADCQRSFQVKVLPSAFETFNLSTQIRQAQARYSGYCHYGNYSSRRITIKILPVTAMDLAPQWTCSALWRSGLVLSSTFNPPGISYWSLPPNSRYPHLQIVPRYQDDPMKLACVLPGFQRGHLNNSLHRPQLQVSIGRSSNNILQEYAYTNLEPSENCTEQQSNMHHLQCFAQNQRPPIFGQWKSNPGEQSPTAAYCDQIAYVLSKNTRNLVLLHSSSRIWETSSLLQDYDPIISATSKNFDMPNILLQLPSDAGIQPLLLHTEPTPKLIRLQGTYQNKDTYRTYLAPDVDIFANLYTEVFRAIIHKPVVSTNAVVRMSDIHPRSFMSCHRTEYSRIIFIASGSCHVYGGTYVRPLSQTESANASSPTSDNRTRIAIGDPTCGETDGYYTVQVRDLKPAEFITVTKRHVNAYENILNPVLTCLWKQYYCFTGTRNKPIQNIIFLEPEPIEQRSKFQPKWFSEETINPRGEVRFPQEVISPRSCPYGEERNAMLDQPKAPPPEGNRVNVDGIQQDPHRIRQNIQRQIKQHFPNKVTNGTVSVDNLHRTCYCTRLLNSCAVPTLPATIAYAIVDPAHKPTDTYMCNAMGRMSKERSHSALLVEYLCPTNSQQGNMPTEKTIQLLQKHLPPIQTVLQQKGKLFNDGQNYASIACTNVYKQCVQYMTHLLTPAPSVYIRFINSSTGSAKLGRYLDTTAHWITGSSNNSLFLNLTNMQPVKQHPFVVPTHTNTSFQKNQLPIEFLVKMSYLQQYSHIMCTYAEPFSSQNSLPVSTKHIAPCAKHHYRFSLKQTRYKPHTIECQVNYSKTCKQPTTLELSLQEPNRSAKHLLVCNSYKWNVQPEQIDNHTRAYCIRRHRHHTVSAVIVTFSSRHWNVQCQAMVTRQNNKIRLVQPLQHLPSVPCIRPPKFFAPLTKLIHSYDEPNTFLVACSLPTWITHRGCPSIRGGNIFMVLQLLSSDNQTSLNTVAVLHTNNTCQSIHSTTCHSYSNYAAGMLLTAHIPQAVLYDMVTDPQTQFSATCAMQKNTIVAVQNTINLITTPKSTQLSTFSSFPITTQNTTSYPTQKYDIFHFATFSILAAIVLGTSTTAIIHFLRRRYRARNPLPEIIYEFQPIPTNQHVNIHFSRG